MYLLLLAPLLLATSCGATCNSLTNVATYRLSINDLYVSFRYFSLSGQNLSFSFGNATEDLNNVVNADQTSYKYLFSDVSSDGATLQIRVNGNNCFSRSISGVNNSTEPTEFEFNVTNEYSGRIELSWNPNQWDNTRIYCTQENNPLIVFGPPPYISHLSATTTSVELEESITYTCYVSGWSGSNYSLSENITFTTKPSSVYALSAVPFGQNAVLLSWQHTNVSLPMFTVTTYKDCTGNGDSSNVFSSKILIIYSLDPGTLYCFTVTATRLTQTSFPATVRIITPEAAPSSVRNLMATPLDSTSVLLRWEEPASPNGVVSYRVIVNSVQYIDGYDTTSLVIRNLQPCRSYTMSVTPRTSAVSGPQFSLTVQTLPPTPQPPVVGIDEQNRNLMLSMTNPSTCQTTVIVTFQPEQSFEDDITESYQFRATISRSSQLKDNVAYTVSARVQNAGGLSDSSTSVLLPSRNVGSTRSVYQRTDYAQIQFSGLDNCTLWNATMSTVSIRNALQQRLEYICPRNFAPLSFRLNFPLTCIGNERLLFRFGNVFEGAFPDCLEYWYSSPSPHIQVGDRLLLADKSCDQLYVSSFEDEACLPRDAVSCPSNSGGIAGGLIGGMILGALLATVIITVTLLTCFRKKIAQRNTQKTGVGSCTVLNTVGIAEPVRKEYKPKKTKPAVHSQPSHDSEDGYEMLPFQGGESAPESQYVENPTNNSGKNQPTFDPEYEVPEVFIKDQEKAAALKRENPSHYEPFELDDTETADATLVANNKVEPISNQKKKATTLPTDLPSNMGTKPAVVMDSTPANPAKKTAAKKTAAKPFAKMPLLPTKTPFTAKKPETNKKSPLVSKTSLSGEPTAAGTGSSVASKTQMFQQASLGGLQPPKPKPKPKGKAANEIPCSDNKAYELWKAANKQ